MKLLSIIAIAFLGIIVYSNSFFCSFHLDDRASIVNDFFIRNIHDLQDIWNILPRRFLLYLSIALNYHFNGLNVFGYHVFNLLVHVVSAILVWWLTLLTLSTPAMKEDKITKHSHLIALLTGLVFVSHPLQTEAVTYIVQRTASMAAMFYVAALCFYVKSRLLRDEKSGLRSSQIYYGFSLVTAIAAMFTKEIAITLPLMILLYEFTFFKSKKDFNWQNVIPLLLTVFIIPLTMYLTESTKALAMRGVFIKDSADISSFHYLLTQFRVMVTYIRLVFLPINQNLDYDYHISKTIFELPTLASLLFLMSILFGAQRLFAKYRLVSFSIFWFFLTLVPESSFLPINDVIFEHRLYLPMAGYSLFLVSGAYYLFQKRTITTVIVVLSILIAWYSFLTYQRNKIWKDELTLWDDTVQKSPHKAMPYNGRGGAYYLAGNFTQAISDYNKAIEINPGFSDAYFNRGVTYYKQGNMTQAMSDFNKAIEISPGKIADAYNNRGLIYAYQNNFNQAKINFAQAIVMNPDDAEAYSNLGNVFYIQGQLAQAVTAYDKALEIDPGNSKAYKNRAIVEEKMGQSS